MSKTSVKKNKKFQHTLKPSSVELNSLESSKLLIEKGDFVGAEKQLKSILSVSSHNLDALKLLGTCLIKGRKQEKRAELLKVCEFALSVDANDPEALYNMAHALSLNKQTKPAFEVLMRRINLDAGNFQYHLDVARFLRDIGKHDESIKAYTHAFKLNKDNVKTLDELAQVYKRIGNIQAVLGCYKKAIQASPTSATFHNSLGAVYAENGMPEESVKSLAEAVRLAPNNPTYRNNLGNSLYRVGRIAEATESYKLALELKPDFYFALTQGLHANRQLCDWRELEQTLEKIHGALEDKTAQGLTPFVMLSQPSISLAENLICAKRFSQDRFSKQLRKKPLINSAKPRDRKDGKIRIGYISADFHAHATSFLIVGVLENHDRKYFDVYAYSHGPDDNSDTRSRVKKSFDVFRDIRKLTDEQASHRILEDGIDILVDLKGFTRDMRLEIQALRPAPVIVSWLGYPGTLGEPRMADYIIGDPTVTPLEHAAHYSEKLALMPHTYQPNDKSRVIGTRPTRAEVGLPEKDFVFCTFNQPYKITPDMLDIWCKILLEIPSSVLWILEPRDATAKNNLIAEAQKRGLSSDRIIFAPKKSQPEHLARLTLADIALDTLPYTSHTTCSDALWVGLPLVTLIGETFPARVAAGLLKTMGLPELVAETPNAYVKTVLDLAKHPKKLAAIKKKILNNRDVSPLFDTPNFTRDLESLYKKMWKNHESIHHDHIIPFAVEKTFAKVHNRKPAPMKIAVVTPYYKETEAELKKCHDSVANQTVACTHFMVADGFAQDIVDTWNVRHIKLPIAHADGGNCGRATGSMAAISEEYDAIAFLDADNWYLADHLEQLVLLHERTSADVCFSRRNFHRIDGSFMREDVFSDGKNFVDTSCYFVTRPAFSLLSVWGLMPKQLWGVCDRIFFAALQSRKISHAITNKATVAYTTRWAEHYTKYGEKPPEGGEYRSQSLSKSAEAFMQLTPVQRVRLLNGTA